MVGHAQGDEQQHLRERVAARAVEVLELIHQVKEHEQQQKGHAHKGHGAQDFAVDEAADGFHVVLFCPSGGANKIGRAHV